MSFIDGFNLTQIAWPVTILLAWIIGECAYSWIKLPRISAYAVVGFLLGASQLGFLPATQVTTVLVANIAFGLILFECGYRINLRWLHNNPWIAVSSLTEALLTFIAIYYLAIAFNQPMSIALLLAALSMATSPATIIRVVNEQASSGQTTERIIHLSILNCVFAIFTFKVILGLVVFRTSGHIGDAIYSSLIALIASMALGVISGFLMSFFLQRHNRGQVDSTLAFTILVIGVVTLAHSLKLSPILAALTLGLYVRHKKIILNTSQRGFGSLGELLSIMLFVFIASVLEWRQMWVGIGLGLAIILVRQLMKIIGIGLFAHVSGISWRKGLLVGLATAPISAFVILMLDQTRYLGIDLMNQLAPLAVAALILEVLGPIIVQRALIWAHEVPADRN